MPGRRGWRQYFTDQRFGYDLPEGLDPAGVTPLLCAGITTYSPLRHWGVGPGTRVGMVGLGGLGHVVLKLAHAMEAEVAQVTISPNMAGAARQLGAWQRRRVQRPAAGCANGGEPAEGGWDALEAVTRQDALI